MEQGTRISVIGHSILLVSLALGGTFWKDAPIPIEPLRVRLLAKSARKKVVVKPKPRLKPKPKPKVKPKPRPKPKPKPKVKPKPRLKPKPKPNPKPRPKPKPKVKPKPRPKAKPKPKPNPKAKPKHKQVVIPKPKPKPKPRPPIEIDFGLSLAERMRRRWNKAKADTPAVPPSTKVVKRPSLSTSDHLSLPDLSDPVIEFASIAPVSPVTFPVLVPLPKPTVVTAERLGSIGLQSEGASQAPDWYLELVERRLTAAWYRPAAVGVVGDRNCTVRFHLNRDGSLGEVSIRKVSGWDPLDRSVLDAVKAGAPFAPLPEGFGSDSGEYFSIRFLLEAME